jgi:hypothetical protein
MLELSLAMHRSPREDSSRGSIREVDYRKLQEELATEQQQNQMHAQLIKSTVESNQLLRMEVDQLKQKLQVAEARSVHIDNLMTLEQKTLELEQKIREADVQFSTVEKENIEQQQRIADLQDENSRLRTDVESASEKYEKLQELYHTSVSTIQRLSESDILQRECLRKTEMEAGNEKARNLLLIAVFPSASRTCFAYCSIFSICCRKLIDSKLSYLSSVRTGRSLSNWRTSSKPKSAPTGSFNRRRSRNGASVPRSMIKRWRG